jgi:broad specificity phosphatase PhoE
VEIIVLRHGKPNIDTTGKVNPVEFGKWIASYDKAGVCESDNPNIHIVERVHNCHFVVCSHLPRSIESARRLGISSPDLISSDFRECEMPHASWKYPKLAIPTWAWVFRIVQLGGYSFNSESYKEAKARGKACAYHLADLAHTHGSVLFVGHGALNWLLHKELLRMGWSGPQKSPREHWAFSEYSY